MRKNILFEANGLEKLEEQFIRKLKGQNSFRKSIRFSLVTGGFLDHFLGTNNWDVETYRKKLEMVFCYQNCSDLL